VNRRAFLGAAGAAALFGVGLPAAARATIPLHRTRWSGIGQTHLWVRQVGDREEAHVRFRSDDGLLIHEGVQALSWTWRDWRDADAAVWVDYRLFDILAWIQTALALEDDAPRCLVLNSGYRTVDRNARIEGAARNSQHIHGRAGDLNFEHVGRRRLAALANAAGAAGVGSYSSFVHIDVGPEGRRW
jgi:uncharacterized protein YcbK (DUF882 family)